MGICIGRAWENADSKNNVEINKSLRAEARHLNNQVRILMLGSGESGKSTIAKQMKIIHMNGFGEDERKAYHGVICQNIYIGLRTLLESSNTFGIKLHRHNQVLRDKYLSEEWDNIEDRVITPEIASEMSSLWHDQGIQQTFTRRSEFQLSDSVQYYLDNIERIGSSDYVPSQQDVLRSRAKTTGIIEIRFKIEQTDFLLIDVGGQRSERKKWMNCFQDITALIYCVSLSDYDIKLEEDNETNRMHESLALFGQICNSKWFVNTCIIIFLNKRDLFVEKLSKTPLTVCFPEWDQSNTNWQDAANFVASKFKEKRLDKKNIYTQITCATDTSNVQFVFNAIKTTILQKAVHDAGFNL